MGSDLVFRSSAFSPETTSGRWLLAHELAHVAQGAGDQPRSKPDRLSVSSPEDPAELEADRMADRVTRGEAVRPASSTGDQIHRALDDEAPGAGTNPTNSTPAIANGAVDSADMEPSNGGSPGLTPTSGPTAGCSAISTPLPLDFYSGFINPPDGTDVFCATNSSISINYRAYWTPAPWSRPATFTAQLRDSESRWLGPTHTWNVDPQGHADRAATFALPRAGDYWIRFDFTPDSNPRHRHRLEVGGTIT